MAMLRQQSIWQIQLLSSAAAADPRAAQIEEAVHIPENVY
jgi:hypothetical protein